MTANGVYVYIACLKLHLEYYCRPGKPNSYCVPISHTHRPHVVAAIVHSAQNVTFSLNSSSHSTEMAPQKNFFQTYVVELSKLYRMMPESWRSAWALHFVPLFSRGVFRDARKTGAALWLPRS